MPSPTRYALRSDDGLEVYLRPEQPGDGANLVDLFEHLSPSSRYMRFSKVMDHPDPNRVRQEAERLAQLLPPQDAGWLAFVDQPGQEGVLVAACRYTRVASDTAEIAVAVRDDFQRRGIGSRLLYFVMEQARKDGIQRIVATFRSDNEPVWRLLQYSPYHITWEPHGPEIDVVIHLQAQPSTETYSALEG